MSARGSADGTKGSPVGGAVSQTLEVALDRRAFMGAAVTAGLVGGVVSAPVPVRAVAPAQHSMPIAMIVHDSTSSEALALADVARSRGFSTAAVAAHDIADLWHDILHAHLQTAPFALVGLTSEAVGFCMEGFAASLWMRPIELVGSSPDAARAALEIVANGRPAPGRPSVRYSLAGTVPIPKPKALAAWMLIPRSPTVT